MHGHHWLSKCKDICQNVFSQMVSITNLSGHSHLLNHLIHKKSGSFVENIEVLNHIKFLNISICSFRGVDLWKLANQKLKWPLIAILFNQAKLCRGFCIHHFYQPWLKLVKGFLCSWAKCEKFMDDDLWSRWAKNIGRNFHEKSNKKNF